MPQSTDDKNNKILFLYSAFFLTGITGLILQVAWTRMLILSFGYTIYSISIVITAFMGGLALGNFIGGKIADKSDNLVKIYGLAELSVGVIALCVFPLLTNLPYIFADIREPLGIPFHGFNIYTFLIAVIIIMPPTTLMGITLPVLSKAITAKSIDAPRLIGHLYGANTLGAALGALITGFYMIANYGIWGTVLIACLINILVGLISIKYFDSGEQLIQKNIELNSDELSRPHGNILKSPMLWFFTLSGFISLSLEIAWIRILSPYLENSTYAFSLVLSIFLLGIGGGSIVGKKFAHKTDNPYLGFGLCQLMIAITTAMSFYLISAYVVHYATILPAHGLIASNPEIILEQLLPISLILLPPTFFMGAGFPFIAMYCADKFKDFGKRTGSIYGANTLGSIAGTLLTGFLLLPVLKTKGVILLTIVITLTNALLLLWNSGKIKTTSLLIKSGVIALAIFTITPIAFLTDPNVKAVQIAYGDNNNIIESIESPDVNITLLQDKINKSKFTLYINLKKVSGSGLGLTPWMTNLPVLMFDHDKRLNLLNIGLGAGVTFASAETHPMIDATVAELLPPVIELHKKYKMYGITDEKNINTDHIVNADGRNYLIANTKPIDIIIIDPTPPLYGAGAVNLYTKDFFEIAKEKMTEDGVILVRVPISADITALKLVLRTISDVFDNTYLWDPAVDKASGFSIVASNRDLSYVTQEYLANSVKNQDFFNENYKNVLLKNIPVNLGKPSELFPDIHLYPVVTDNNPYLEFPLSY